MPRAHEKDNGKKNSPQQNNTATAGNGDAQALMGQLAPLLERWLRDNLSEMGVQITGKRDQTTDPPTKPRSKGSRNKTGNTNPPLLRPHALRPCVGKKKE